LNCRAGDVGTSVLVGSEAAAENTGARRTSLLIGVVALVVVVAPIFFFFGQAYNAIFSPHIHKCHRFQFGGSNGQAGDGNGQQ